MSDSSSETPVRLTRAAREWDVSVRTMKKWGKGIGTGGRILNVFLMGGLWYTTRESLQRFRVTPNYQNVQGESSDQSPIDPPTVITQPKNDFDGLSNELQELGLEVA